MTVWRWLAGLGRCVASFYGFWIKSRMTAAATLPLWIADQVRNDVTSCPAVPALWIPAYAGMTGRRCWERRYGVCGGDVRPAPPLWIADQVRNELSATVVSSGYSAWRVPALWVHAFAGMTEQFPRVVGTGSSLAWRCFARIYKSSSYIWQWSYLCEAVWAEVLEQVRY